MPRRSSNKALSPSLSLSLSRSTLGGWGCGWYWVCGAVGSRGVVGLGFDRYEFHSGLCLDLGFWLGLDLVVDGVCCGGAAAALV